MRTAVALSALLLALAGVAAGCGGGSTEASSPPATETETAPMTDTETTPPATDGPAVDGAAVWESAGCGGCHTLAAAGSQGSIGPNLDDLQPDAETVANQVRNGGGAMPSFSDSLTEDEIQAVAEYVATNAGQ